MVKSLVVIADSLSAYDAQELVHELQSEGYSIKYLGNIASRNEIDSDLKIINQLNNKLVKLGDDILLGITSSGNSIAIYSNKLDGFNTAPISEVEDVEISIKNYKCNSFDVSINNPKIKLIISEIFRCMEGVK